MFEPGPHIVFTVDKESFPHIRVVKAEFVQQVRPAMFASQQQVLIVHNLDTSVAYLNYHYLWCFVLLAMTASQHLKV